MNNVLAGLLCLFTCTDPSYTLQDNKLFHEACRSISVYITQGPAILAVDNGKYVCKIKSRRFDEDEMRLMLRLNKAKRNRKSVSLYD